MNYSFIIPIDFIVEKPIEHHCPLRIGGEYDVVIHLWPGHKVAYVRSEYDGPSLAWHVDKELQVLKQKYGVKP